MSSPVAIPSSLVDQSESSGYVIQYQKITERPAYIEQETLTNQQALRKISEYLENATNYLRKKRLEQL